jgi:outer membrane protein OmpA-like peptidoglycan-associated protein
MPLPGCRYPCRGLLRRLGALAIAATFAVGTLAVATPSFMSSVRAADRGTAGAGEARPDTGGQETSAAPEHRAGPARAELIAARLLASARQDLTDGRPEVAHGVLELMVGRFSETASAQEARVLLGSLAAENRAIVAAGSDQGAGRAGIAPSSWRVSVVGLELHNLQLHQEQLRSSVGDRIFFSAGSFDLGSRARSLIAGQAAWLLERPELGVIVEGHADDAMVGVDNALIAESRAGVVRDGLMAAGVPADRVRISPQADRDRVAICSDSDCAAHNRRALVRVWFPSEADAGHSDAGAGTSASNGALRR